MIIPVKETIYDTAIALADQGIPVFPCLPGKKIPAVNGGFHAATTDNKQITSWFDGSKFNLAIPTGEVSGLLVIDYDCYKPGSDNSLAELESKYGKLPNTFTVKTRAGGLQFYFQYPQGSGIGCSAGKFGEGIDVRGNGGYVVAAPSWVEADNKGPAGYYKFESDVTDD